MVTYSHMCINPTQGLSRHHVYPVMSLNTISDTCPLNMNDSDGDMSLIPYKPCIHVHYLLTFFFIYFIHWRLITLQYCSGFCHTLTWISHGFTCVPHPDPPSCLPLHPIPLGLPSAPALSTCLMHPTWAGDLFHPWLYTCFNAVLSEYPTLTFSHRV